MSRHPFFLLAIPLLALLCSCRQAALMPPCECEVPTGMLVFLRDTAGMGQAIAASTGSYTHVAVAVCTDSGDYLYEATPRLGVACRPFAEALADWHRATDTARPLLDYVDFCQLTVPFDTLRLLRRLHSFVGQSYDDAFLPDNGRLYCSELVYESFFSPRGNRLFTAKPMNFRAPDGSMPPYWLHHFDSLGMAVPEGVPGTNPTAMHDSTLLQPIKFE